MSKTLNIVGCGKVGKVLGRLWAEHGTFCIQDVLNQSAGSAAQATAFIGAGRAISDHRELRPADAWLIGTQDDRIENCCTVLAEHALFRPDNLVFHCSGALASSALSAAARCGALTASCHPVRSFANPDQLVHAFAGTYCGMEGNAEALAQLAAAFGAIGAQPVEIRTESKAVYHAAAVFASNYLVTLMDVALRAYEQAGIPRQTAMKMVEPLARGTIDNVLEQDTTAALTGPIARGDMATVVRQYRALKGWDRRAASLYRQLAAWTMRIARRKRNAPRGG